MKGIIMYYSQTGNTRKIAEAIYSGSSTVLEQIDLVHISKADYKNLKDYDVVGIGMPVWCEREPVNVVRFIENMTGMEGKFAFVFCTHTTLAGKFMKRIVSLLEEKKMIVTGWEDWYGGNVSPISEKPYYTDGHPDDTDLREARDFGKDIMEKCIRIADGDSTLIPRLPEGKAYADRYGELAPVLPPQISPNEAKPSKPDVVFNKDICGYPACSLCKDHCPAECIDPSREKPLDISSCERCHFCENICPTGAITFVRRMHIDKNNPVSIQLANDLLEHRELRRFRPLVSFDEVGMVIPSEEELNRHPRFVLENGVGVPTGSLNIQLKHSGGRC
jgi:flavodoxin/formate hydrogenlyase subunit 6/NADH:ubiquinone oxidoreductase subunit I